MNKLTHGTHLQYQARACAHLEHTAVLFNPLCAGLSSSYCRTAGPSSTGWQQEVSDAFRLVVLIAG